MLYHCWGARPILEGDTVRGVIFESKEGRKAVLAKVVIDATGDGDIFAQTGTPYSSLADGGTAPAPRRWSGGSAGSTGISLNSGSVPVRRRRRRCGSG